MECRMRNSCPTTVPAMCVSGTVMNVTAATTGKNTSAPSQTIIARYKQRA